MDFTNPPAQQVVEVPVTNPAPQSAATATALAATGSDGGVSQIWLMVAASFVLAGSALLYLRRRASLDTKK
jgi:LPXTG-motif cell wall-anchored protein